MSDSSKSTTLNPSQTEKPKRSRGAKIVGAWFVGSISLVILLFSPLRPFNEIWTQPRIFIFTPSGQLDLPNTVLWIMATIISISLVYFGIGSIQSSTHQTNVIQTPTDWMVKFIISFCWNSFHKDPSIPQDELFAQVSNRIPMISSLEGSVDVSHLMGAGSGGDTSASGQSSTIERVLARVERLSQKVDVSGTILTPIELEDGKKAYMRINIQPKESGERRESTTTAVSTHMLLDPHDIPELSLLSAADRQALGVVERHAGDQTPEEKKAAEKAAAEKKARDEAAKRGA